MPVRSLGSEALAALEIMLNTAVDFSIEDDCARIEVRQKRLLPFRSADHSEPRASPGAAG
jgi:hypothetical protein